MVPMCKGGYTYGWRLAGLFLYFIELSLCFWLKTFSATYNMTLFIIVKMWFTFLNFPLAQKGSWMVIVWIPSIFYDQRMSRESLHSCSVMRVRVSSFPTHTHMSFNLSWLSGHEAQREFLKTVVWNKLK